MARFILVKCKCGNEQKIFGAPSLDVRCGVCNEPLATATGGKAALHGRYIRDVE